MEISVRRAEPGDFEAVARHMDDESAYSGTLQVPFASREVWRKRMAEPLDGEFFLVACAGDEIVGNAGLHTTGKSPRRSHAMAIGMAVPSAWQRKGVGSAPAIALYRKFGFEIEGTHKAYALRAGRYVDAYAMARLKAKPVVV
jgi:putative acetyltransferase